MAIDTGSDREGEETVDGNMEFRLPVLESRPVCGLSLFLAMKFRHTKRAPKIGRGHATGFHV